MKQTEAYKRLKRRRKIEFKNYKRFWKPICSKLKIFSWNFHHTCECTRISSHMRFWRNLKIRHLSWQKHLIDKRSLKRIWNTTRKLKYSIFLKDHKLILKFLFLARSCTKTGNDPLLWYKTISTRMRYKATSRWDQKFRNLLSWNWVNWFGLETYYRSNTAWFILL